MTSTRRKPGGRTATLEDADEAVETCELAPYAVTLLTLQRP